MEKPKVPVTVIGLSLVCVAGLVALFLAARAAFATVAGAEQAVAAALLIEAGAIWEAVTFARSRNKIALVGLVLSFLVSATYNYTQAAEVRPDLEIWQLLALALGPLTALAFVSLALGEELRLYFERMEAWRASEAHKADLAVKRRERWERRQVETSVDDRTVPGQGDNGRTDGGRWPDKESFVSDGDRPDDLSAVELAAMTGQSERNARRWLAAARGQEGGDGTETE
jgi:hypothetical protein